MLEEGLYAWTSGRTPRGLRDQNHHGWMHDGVVVGRITLAIEDISETDYRAGKRRRPAISDGVAFRALATRSK